MPQQEFSIIPVLGRKTDVPQNDPTLFKEMAGQVVTNDVGGINFDLTRKRNACAKANGYAQWSKTANSSATKCLALFELYDGTNRVHLSADNGVFYQYDSDRAPTAIYTAILGFDSGSEAPAIGARIDEHGGDGVGYVARIEVSTGTWGATNAAGNFYLQNVSGTWTNNSTIDINGGTVDIATVDGSLTTTTFATDNYDLYSQIQVGSYYAFTDRAEHQPMKWKYGDQRLTPLNVVGDTAYTFRYLLNFTRRVIGLYCPNDTGAPELSVRWSSAWPATAITAMDFPAANQLYVPNDDPIVGGATLGTDKCFIFCENSIQQLVYYPDYETPFQCFTVIPNIGAANHHSIVSIGSRLFFYNKDFGFMEFSGTSEPAPISDDIMPDLAGILSGYENLIYGKYIPNIRCIVWTVPMLLSATPNRLLFYYLDQRQWFVLDRSFRCLDYWKAYSTYTWQDLIRDLGGLGKDSGTADTNTVNKLVDSTADFVAAGVAIGDEAHNTTDGTYGIVTEVTTTALTFANDPFPDGNEKYEIGTGATWADAGSGSWASYAALQGTLVSANTDGHVYGMTSESLPTETTFDGYRLEPVLDFGDAKRKDLLEEIWFQISHLGSHSIDIYYRSGDTLAEITGAGWTSIGSISCNAPAKPVVYVAQSARLHQIKWGTDGNTEYFEVNKITFKYIPQSEN